MTKQRLSVLVFLLAVSSASATVYMSTYDYVGPIYGLPDGNLNGAYSSINVIGAPPVLYDIRVAIEIAGGYNGDLYGYVSHNGVLVPLVNRIGVRSGNVFGSDGAGMNVTFADGAAGNIHAAGNGFLTGSYRPDGQNISPLSAPGSFDAGGGTITLNGTFGNMDPNGSWTLFFADVVTGGGSFTINGWNLQISSVPEPGVCSLAILGLVLMARRRSLSSRDPLGRAPQKTSDTKEDG
jgi:hypothetical protein